MSESYIPLLHINAVSYEGSLFGINVDVNAASDEIIRTEMAFGFHETPGSLKALAISSQGRYMICAGMDEYIRIFDLQKKRSMGEMSGHTGCVTALSFIGEKFVISASEDGTMIIWRVNGWQKLHILGGHKGPVNDLALHPSGKLCLSVSRDNTLKIWNLVHGRCAFTRRLKGFASKVEWHQESDFYFLVVNNEVQIYNSAGNNECTATIVCPARVNQARFVDIGAAHQEQASESGVYVCVVCEDSSMHFFTEKGGRVGAAHDLAAALHGSRPRDMWCCAPSAAPSEADADFREYMDGEGHAITVISSAGGVVVYSARRLCEGDGEEAEGGDEEDEEEDGDGAGAGAGDDGKGLEDGTAFACLARFSIPSEPRLTAVVAYDPSIAAANPTSKQAKRAREDAALELATEVEVEVGVEAKSKAGRSKRKKEQEEAPAAAVSSKSSDKKKKKKKTAGKKTE